MTYFDYFPAGYTPNSQQEFILEELDKARLANKRFVVINAPVGSGKSHIAKTLANSINEPSDFFREFVESGAIYDIRDDDDAEGFSTEGASILTMSKTLQNQYYNTFSDGVVLKGKRNYECIYSDELSCDLGPCNFDMRFKRCEDCYYYMQRDEAVKAKCSFYSYSMFMSLPLGCRMKKVLVCDEASELEDILVKAYSVSFNFSALQKLKIALTPTPPEGSEYEKYLLWLRTTKNSIDDAAVFAREKLNNKKKKTREDQIKYRAIMFLKEQCDRLLDGLSCTEFIFEHSPTSLEFKPLHVNELAQRLFKYCDLVVFMSATIIDHRNFTRQLGIKEGEYYYIEAESTFDPKKAPIRLSDKIGVTYQNKAVVVPKLAKIAKSICDHHKGQKGIIHTHNMDITNIVSRECNRDKRFLFRADGSTNEQMLQAHIERKDDTILVSPSMTHGVSLDGDLGEFSIIMKAPFLPLGDKRVKRLVEIDKDWYDDKMISTFVQMCGRTIRSHEDTSVTYVLDAVLTKRILENKHKIPKYILDRIV